MYEIKNDVIEHKIMNKHSDCIHVDIEINYEQLLKFTSEEEVVKDHRNMDIDDYLADKQVFFEIIQSSTKKSIKFYLIK